jgi:hypothetical protein
MAAPIGQRGSQQFNSQNHTTSVQQFKCQDKILVIEPEEPLSPQVTVARFAPDICLLSTSYVETFMPQSQKDVNGPRWVTDHVY